MKTPVNEARLVEKFTKYLIVCLPFWRRLRPTWLLLVDGDRCSHVGEVLSEQRLL